jgi:thymidylate synthase ThyX
MPDLLCKKCDVYVGYSATGAVQPPHDRWRQPQWLANHCWVCGRSAAEVAADPYDLYSTRDDDRTDLGRAVTRMTHAPGPLGEGHDPRLVTPEGQDLNQVDDPTGSPEPSTAITRYVDKAMFKAEQVEAAAVERPRVYLLSATPDPLGAVAAFAMMYEGRVVRDLAEITDEERVRYFDDCFNTALRTPLEAIDLHFMMEGITRATWDQARTQRTAVFAGESLRFAVKEGIVNRPGPSVAGKRREEVWEGAIEKIHEAYLALVADGVPAEDARGLLPMNVLTRGHYKTNLRNLEAEVGKRLCTQAQFEWRLLHADLRRSIREHDVNTYQRAEDRQDHSSHWQFEHIAESPMFQPICFQKGACMFKAQMDRGCTIRERVDRGAFGEIKTEEWLADPTAAWIR